MRRKKLLQAVAALCIFSLALVLFSGCSTKNKPSINSISPTSGEAGAEVSITGVYFGDSRGSSTVRFGNVTVNASEWSDSEIKVKVPSDMDAGEHAVSVTTDSGTGTGMNFTVEEKKEEPDSGDDADREQEITLVKEAMLAYARAYTANEVELTMEEFWMSDDGTEAEAVLRGVYISGENQGQTIEAAGITAVKQNGSWIITDFGTDIPMKHL